MKGKSPMKYLIVPPAMALILGLGGWQAIACPPHRSLHQAYHHQAYWHHFRRPVPWGRETHARHPNHVEHQHAPQKDMHKAH
jgi:hypothetical protein